LIPLNFLSWEECGWCSSGEEGFIRQKLKNHYLPFPEEGIAQYPAFYLGRGK